MVDMVEITEVTERFVGFKETFHISFCKKYDVNF